MYSALLIIIVVILIYYAYMYRQAKSQPVIHIVAPSTLATNDTTSSAAAKPTEGQSREAVAAKENMEYFTSCGGVTLPNISSCGTKYAENDYGIPGGNYVDYVMSKTVEPTIVANHKEFIRDRVSGQAENQIITGRTYSPDSHQSYDPIKWGGLLRPQNVPVCNPDQVPDVDFDLYTNKRTITW